MVFSRKKSNVLCQKKAKSKDRKKTEGKECSLQVITEVRRISEIQNPQFQLQHQFGIVITKRTISELENEGRDGWLSDDLVDYYLQLVCAKSQNCEARSAGFFLTNIRPGRRLRRTRRGQEIEDFFERRLIFIPLIRENHWTLAVINCQNHFIDYYDSLNLQPCPNEIKIFIEEELRLNNRDYHEEGWTIRTNLNYPKQSNSYDCGAFVCQYAKHLAFEQEMRFSQVSF